MNGEQSPSDKNSPPQGQPTLGKALGGIVGNALDGLSKECAHSLVAVVEIVETLEQRAEQLEHELDETKARCVMWAESKGTILRMYEEAQAKLASLSAASSNVPTAEEMNLHMDVDDIKAAIGEAHPSIDDMARDLLIEKVDRLHGLAYRNLDPQAAADITLRAHTEICSLFSENSGDYDPTPDEVDNVHDDLTRILGDVVTAARSSPSSARSNDLTATPERRPSLELSEVKPDGNEGQSGEVDREGGRGDPIARGAALVAGRAECGSRDAGREGDREKVAEGAALASAGAAVSHALTPMPWKAPFTYDAARGYIFDANGATVCSCRSAISDEHNALIAVALSAYAHLSATRGSE